MRGYYYLIKNKAHFLKALRTIDYLPVLFSLLQLACKTDREYRASEICRLMTSEHAVGLAIKYASRSRRLQLATRLSKIAQEMMEAEEEEEEEEEEEMETYSREMTSG